MDGAISALCTACVAYAKQAGTRSKRMRCMEKLDVQDIKNEGKTFSITMFSYAGIPPLAGFCSKFYLFFAALGCGAYFLAPVGVVTSVIGRWAAGRLPRKGKAEASNGEERRLGREGMGNRQR
ncbi:hypothetical protein QVD17_24847 [Tagetes erecta]|uniref:NADH:quinone oxidoreductase/Mrp antiporter transmembrane domain-containing protein n=1 Tax=Tagetes erecta TaxID=13708 RepID=A0AAD8NUZ8_TARER|nr:hypothetical protein QVD17_24847 [Tagetes erecta]